jgi:glycosyltransferase involved in cell wall biosynthesis
VYGIEEMTRPRVREVVLEILRSEGVEVLHLHHWATLSIDVLRAARALEVGSVVTLHAKWAACPRFFRRPPAAGIECPAGDGRVPLWSLRHGIANRDRDLRGELGAASAVCAPSAAAAALIARHVPWSGPIEVVPHGLLEPVRGVLPARRGGAVGARRIGTFGNLVRAKGVALLVEAMAGIAEAELHLFGPFLERDLELEVRAQAERSGVTLSCHGAYGHAAEERHPARQLDLAVFPSLCQETYGLVVEEALARGVPVVVSDAGALAERIGGGGVVTEAGNPAALHRALRSLVEDAGRYAELCRGIPREFPTIADAACRYTELYRAAVGTPA